MCLILKIGYIKLSQKDSIDLKKMKTFKDFSEQLDPGKSYIPKATGLMHIDTRSGGDKVKNLEKRVKYYGGFPPKGPK